MGALEVWIGNNPHQLKTDPREVAAILRNGGSAISTDGTRAAYVTRTNNNSWEPAVIQLDGIPLLERMGVQNTTLLYVAAGVFLLMWLRR